MLKSNFLKATIAAMTLFLIGGSSIISADGPTETKSSKLNRIQTPKDRPEAPSMQEITCTLSEDGLLTLSFRIDEGMAELTLDDGTEVFTDHFDTAAPYVTTVSDPTATISLTVTTDKGNTYEGEI